MSLVISKVNECVKINYCIMQTHKKYQTHKPFCNYKYFSHIKCHYVPLVLTIISFGTQNVNVQLNYHY